MRSLSFLIVGFLTLLGGCAGSTSGVESPRIQLADVRFLGSRVFEQKMLIDLRVTNPNNFDVALEGVSFDFEVNDSHFASGLTNEGVTVPRLGDATVPVPVSTTLLDIVREALRLTESGEISYRLSGFAFVTEGVGTRKVPFEAAGRLRLLPPKPSDDAPLSI